MNVCVCVPCGYVCTCVVCMCAYTFVHVYWQVCVHGFVVCVCVCTCQCVCLCFLCGCIGTVCVCALCVYYKGIEKRIVLAESSGLRTQIYLYYADNLELGKNRYEKLPLFFKQLIKIMQNICKENVYINYLFILYQGLC